MKPCYKKERLKQQQAVSFINSKAPDPGPWSELTRAWLQLELGQLLALLLGEL